MIRKGLMTALVMSMFFAAMPADAQFQAADLIYLPAIAHTSGANGTEWRSDLYITNVETEASIDIAVVYIQSGLISNSNAFIDRSLWLGGREADGFGFINESLRDIPPGGTVVIEDPIGLYWGTENGTNFGGLVIFAYEAGSLEDDGTRVYKNAIVNSRDYTPFSYYQEDPANEGEFLPVVGTFGQTLPGLPWYNLADSSAVTEETDFSFLVMTGGTENEDFRYNLGVMNASDPLTAITVTIQAFQGDGSAFLDLNGDPLIYVFSMPPASHTQFDSFLLNLFGFASAPKDIRVDVSIIAWTSSGTDPVVGMTVYGNYIDNRTQDPTAILPAFAYPYNVECQWPSSEAKADGSSSEPFRRVNRRPFEIAPR